MKTKTSEIKSAEKDYRHYDKSDAPITLQNLRLKWYHLAKADAPDEENYLRDVYRGQA